MRDPLIFNSFCFVRGSFWASGEAPHGVPLAEPVYLQNRQKHVFSTFWRQICSKTRVFPRFWLQNASKPRIFLRFGFRIAQKHAFSTFCRQICSKTRVFPRFGFRIAQKHAFFHVLVSEFLKNTRVSTYLASKRCVFPRFGFRIAQKRVFFNVFAFKVAQSHVFSQVLASTLFKKRALHNFSLQISTAVFRRFWFEEVQKNTFFPCVLFQNFAMQGVFFYRQAPLHTGASRTKAFTHRRYTHRQSTHRLFCTTNCFTHISFCTSKHLNTSAFYRGL